MARRGRTVRRFAASARGVAAIEFALVFPMLLVMLLASIDAGRAVAIYMKVRATAYALDSMTNQYTNIDKATLQNIEGAASAVLAPYSSTPSGLRISQIEITTTGGATGAPIVAWSEAVNMTAYTYNTGNNLTLPGTLSSTEAPNNACPTSFYTSGNVNRSGCYVLLAEVQYTYTPMFTKFITGPITLYDSLWVVPRNSLCVQRNSACYNSD
jgi:Flp pilus assembly protein TadG